MILFDPICSSLIQFIPFWSNLIKFEHVWASLNQFSPFGSDLIKFDQVLTACFKIAQKCSKFSKMVDNEKLFLRPRAKLCSRSKNCDNENRVILTFIIGPDVLVLLLSCFYGIYKVCTLKNNTNLSSICF